MAPGHGSRQTLDWEMDGQIFSQKGIHTKIRDQRATNVGPDPGTMGKSPIFIGPIYGWILFKNKGILVKPPNGWFINNGLEKPMNKWDDLGGFTTPIFGNTHICFSFTCFFLAIVQRLTTMITCLKTRNINI